MAGSSAGLPAVYRGYRRTLIMAAVVAVMALVGLIVAGEPLAGVLVSFGLGIGAWNSSRVHELSPTLVVEDRINGRAASMSSARRLGYITVLVVAIAIALRPVGWTVVLGLAGFQLLLVANTVGPLVREVRRG